MNVLFNIAKNYGNQFKIRSQILVYLSFIVKIWQILKKNNQRFKKSFFILGVGKNDIWHINL